MTLAALALMTFSVAHAQATPEQMRAAGIGVDCSNLVCDFENEWRRNNGMIFVMADAMPAESFGYKPTPAQQTFAQRVLHSATVNVMLMQAMGGKTSVPQINEKVTAKAEVLAELQRASGYGLAVLKEFDEAGLATRFASTPQLAFFMGKEVSRIRVLAFMMEHMQNVYGQLAVYLRLTGVTPPLSREP
jgi:uncharacterized damage-inducible protein DinB